MPVDVRHSLDAADRDHIVNSASNGLIAYAHRGPARGASGLDGHGLDTRETRVVGDQTAELRLLSQNAGEHVADVQSVDRLRFDAGVSQGFLHGCGAEIPAAALRVLVDR